MSTDEEDWYSRGLDHSRIDYPCDRMTLGEIRRGDPAAFPHGNLCHGSSIGGSNPLLFARYEQSRARRVYEDEQGIGSFDSTLEEEEDVLRALNDHYVKMGWSSGLEESREMLQRVEVAAREQGREWKAELQRRVRRKSPGDRDNGHGR